MKKFTKTGILLLTLAIPVFIWLFLKNFGQNQFALPVYYETKYPLIQGCDTGLPHLAKFHVNNGLDASISINYLLPEVCDQNCQLVLERLSNLQTTLLEYNGFGIYVFADKSSYNPIDLEKLKDRYLANSNMWEFVTIESRNKKKSLDCSLLISASSFTHPIVLVDQNYQIRGYYDALEIDEMDRLKGEVKILSYTQSLPNSDSNN